MIRERKLSPVELVSASLSRIYDLNKKLNIYLTDMTGQDILNEISARHFDPANPPPRTLVGVAELAHPKMLVEIEAMVAVSFDP